MTDFIKLQRACPQASLDLHLRRLRPAKANVQAKLAEGEGFEPPALARYGFQDRRLRPLGHPSGFGIIADAVDARKPLT
jgi:hypothetical protein